MFSNNMRNITFDAIQAFNKNQNFSGGNTVVKIGVFGRKLLLHGNLIAGTDENGFFVDSCGYMTNTTKERLNGLEAVSIQQKKGVWFLNDEIWNGQKIYINQ